MSPCDFNNIVFQIYWNLTLSRVFSCKFAAYFQKTFSLDHLRAATSVFSSNYRYTSTVFNYWYLPMVHFWWGSEYVPALKYSITTGKIYLRLAGFKLRDFEAETFLIFSSLFRPKGCKKVRCKAIDTKAKAKSRSEWCNNTVYSNLFNPSSANPTKWANSLKQFVGSCRRIVWMCLTIFWGWDLKN